LARTVGDIALLFKTIATPSAKQRRTTHLPSQRARKPCIGVPKNFFLEIISPEVEKAFETSLHILGQLGAKMKEVTLPYLQQTEHAGNLIAWAEATLYHQESGWYPGRSSEYSEDVRGRLEMGEKVTAIDYLKAMDLREKFIAGFHLALMENEVDLIVTPTTPITAPRIGEEKISFGGIEHGTRALLLRNNRPANLGGIPSLSVPCGLTQHGLPAGLQLTSGLTGEPLLLELADRFEQACPLKNRPALA